MLPSHRLPVLLDQAKQSQISKCLYHNPSTSLSLFSDHTCDRSHFPLRTIMELSGAAGEVWYLEFSQDGSMLAVSGDDFTVLIYDTSNFRIRHKLAGHTGSVVYVAWSPDSTRLITCSRDQKAKMWDPIVSVSDECLANC